VSDRIACQAQIIRIGGPWADSRKPSYCQNNAKYRWVRLDGTVEMVCGTHANTAQRWYRQFGHLETLTGRPT
jgi:hypothetical protein